MPIRPAQTALEPLTLAGIFGDAVPHSFRVLNHNLLQLNATSHPLLIDSIKILYSAFIVEVEDDQRKAVFEFLVQEVKAAEMHPSALMAFIQYETNHFLVRRAVRSFLELRRVDLDDPYAACIEIILQMKNKQVVNLGAVLAGLVCFGDRRTCALLRTIRSSITAPEARAFAHATAGPLRQAGLEFCLEWLIELQRTAQLDIAVQIAAALSVMVLEDETLIVHDYDHAFGPYAIAHGQTSREISFMQFLSEVKPLLKELEESDLPALQGMLEIFENPGGTSIDVLERRKVTTRRMLEDRRVSDRRIVSITPLIDRRSDQRRQMERREGARR
ncbi:MAG: hypothetical protein AAF525_12200 [Pseudomonadota bacterium]